MANSIYTNLNPDKLNEIYNSIVDSKLLGKLKLETISNRAIFILLVSIFRLTFFNWINLAVGSASALYKGLVKQIKLVLLP